MIYLFDMDGTLIEGFLNPKQPYERVEVLPGRKEKLAELHSAGHVIGIVTNQGSIAFGYNTEEDARTKLALALQKLDLPPDTPLAICFSDPRSKDSRYNQPEDCGRRKPSGAMIRELMQVHADVVPSGVLFVGDRPEDEKAAQDAGVEFMWADAFFAPEVAK